MQRAIIWLLKHMPTMLIRRLAGPALVIDGNQLDPHMQLIAKMAEKDRPPHDPAAPSPDVNEVRAQIAAMKVLDAPRRAGVMVEDTTMPGPAGPMKVRLYRPRQCPDQAPAILFFHQGGLVVMDLDTDDTFCSVMADEANALVISLDYRLCPENEFPAPIDDALALWAHVQDHAAALNIDPARIGLAGDSAGGLIASVVAQEIRDQGGVQPAAQLLVYPWVTTEDNGTGSLVSCAETFPLTRETMDFFNAMVFPDDKHKDHKWANPLKAKTLADLPPAIIATAGFDPIRDQGNAYAAALKQAGNQVTDYCFTSLTHSFLVFGNVSQPAQRASVRLAQDLADLLKR